jgi:hypothetical protein
LSITLRDLSHPAMMDFPEDEIMEDADDAKKPMAQGNDKKSAGNKKRKHQDMKGVGSAHAVKGKRGPLSADDEGGMMDEGESIDRKEFRKDQSPAKKKMQHPDDGKVNDGEDAGQETPKKKKHHLNRNQREKAKKLKALAAAGGEGQEDQENKPEKHEDKKRCAMLVKMTMCILFHHIFLPHVRWNHHCLLALILHAPELSVLTFCSILWL